MFKIATKAELQEKFKCCAIDVNVSTDYHRLLWYQVMSYENGGMHGWNFDAYILKGKYCITVGCRNLADDYKVDYELLHRLDQQAKAILKDESISFEDGEKKIDELLDIFLESTFRRR